MNQTQAIAKLRKILGKSFAYRTDPKALTGEEREAAKGKATELAAAKRELEARTHARLVEVLKADAEYQRLKAELAAARVAHETAWGWSYRRRVTVGNASSLAFHVKAEGDNWDEVVRKVIDKVT